MTQPSSSSGPKLSNLKYLVTSVQALGSGSTVMVITDKNEGGTYALKAIKREGPIDDVVIERAKAECEASQKLNFSAILKNYDFRILKKWLVVPYRAELLMEYVDGKTMGLLEKLKMSHSMMIFQKVAAALAHMHRRDVIHGDVRPSQVMLSRTGQVKLRGYCLSLVPESVREQITPDKNFAAPERIQDGAVNKATDIFGLGAMMYFVTTGRPVGSVDRTEERLQSPSSINSKIPGPLSELTVSCIQLKPDRRPQDMYEVAKQLDSLVQKLGLDERELAGLAADREGSPA
jgi:serine/threonine-protein kinase